MGFYSTLECRHESHSQCPGMGCQCSCHDPAVQAAIERMVQGLPQDESIHEYCPGGCGWNFREFPEARHEPDECGGPECTCYEGPGHQPGCPYGHKMKKETTK